ARVVTGRDAAGLPTVGYIVLVEWKDASRPMSAAFFYLVAPNEFACTDAGSDETERWTVEAPTVDEYLRGVLRDSGNDRPTSGGVRPEPPTTDAAAPTVTALTATSPESGMEKGK